MHQDANALLERLVPMKLFLLKLFTWWNGQTLARNCGPGGRRTWVGHSCFAAFAKPRQSTIACQRSGRFHHVKSLSRNSFIGTSRFREAR